MRGTGEISPRQKSICAPIFTKRGVSTDVGASQRCAGMVAAGLKLWLKLRVASEFVTLMMSIPTL
jgi:hypothetical protein